METPSLVPHSHRPRTVTALRINTALRLAEKRQYRELLQVIHLRADLAKQQDEYGMTPLHWICTDPDVPLRIVQQTVLAYPEATTVRNLAGLLPLHVAVCKDLPLDLLKTMLKCNPKAILAETPDGKTATELAQQHVTSQSVKVFLHMLAQEVQSLANDPPSKSIGKDQSRSITTHSTVSNRSDLSEQMTEVPSYQKQRHERSASTPAVLSRAPEWKLADHCQLCHAKFGYFKSRHHCRNCGESVCSRHSKHFIPLTHLGLYHPQRVCTNCHTQLQAHYSYRAVALSPRRRAATQVSPQHNPNFYVDFSGDVTYEDNLPSEWLYSSHPRRTRSVENLSSDRKGSPIGRSSPNQNEGATYYSPQPSPRQPPRPLYPPPLPPQSDRATARSNNSRSSTLDTNNNNSTMSNSSRMPAQFIKTPSAVSMYLTRMQRADGDKTVSQRLKEQEEASDASTTIDSSSRQWGDTKMSSSSTASANSTTNQSSNDTHTLKMETQMHKLTIAKEQIHAALVKSRLAGERAVREKAHYDALAKVYEDRGFTDNEISYTQRHDENGTEESVEDLDNQVEHESDCDILSDAQEVDELTLPAANALFSDSHIHASLDYAATYYDLAVALIAKQEFTKAVIELRKSLELEPKNTLAWYHLAKALDGKGELLEAEAAIQTALELQPHSLPSLSLLGKLLNARGEHDEAIMVFRKALSLQSQQHPGEHE